MGKQLQLFEELDEPRKAEDVKGKSRDVVFNDYESFVKKFTETPKTTDDCYTPRDVYEAVLRYVGEVYPLDGKKVLRPFFPGGDYVNAYYPPDGVVVDNPPFSMFSKVCNFFMGRNIPFFVFGPGLTIMEATRKGCTAVIVAPSIKFENGAVVKCNFASNLFGDAVAIASARLSRLLAACPSQNVSKALKAYKYPENVISTSLMQTIAKGDEDFTIRSKDAETIKRLDSHKGLFGAHLLASSAAAKAAAAKAAIVIELSEREKQIVKRLDSSGKDI